MKVTVIQPEYSTDFSKCDFYFEKMVKLLDKIDSSDIIVLPESSDIPCRAGNYEEHIDAVNRFNKRLIDKCTETAIRCKSMVFVNATDVQNGNYNTTFTISKDGEIIDKYYKEHLTPSEPIKYKRVSDYSFEYSAPHILETDNLRIGFLTCYDNYFYENYSNLARYNLDIIIACSHQRSDLHEPLKFMTQFCAYNTNTYVLRSSVGMGDDSLPGGSSMIVSPKGEVLAELFNKEGIINAEINPKDKYLKPAGFGNPPAAHYEYIESGRRPYKYRPAGSAICKTDEQMPYPRVCAHRGLNRIAPENSLPAYGAAVALSAEEIEFDLRYTKDGEIVSVHDYKLERVSNGTGKISDYTYEELLQFDFGSHFSDNFKGLKIIKFEEILKKFACHVIMNIHAKNIPKFLDEEKIIKKIVSLIKQYDCEKYVYIMTGNDELMLKFKEIAPEIPRCVGAGVIMNEDEVLPNKSYEIVDRAIKMDCQKVQLFKPFFTQEMIDKAHKHGIICNMFYSDDEEETKEFLNMGIDVILTNDFCNISRVVKEFKASSTT